MLDWRVRKLLKPINLLVCLSILMGLITACVPPPPRRYVAPTPEARAAQDTGPQVSREPVPQPVPTPPPAAPVVVPGAGGIEPVSYDVPLPPRPPGMASYLAHAPAAYHVEVSDPAGASISMEPGWHLVSLPEEPVDTDPAAVLASIAGSYARVYAYDGCDLADPWKLYDPADPEGSDLTAIDHRMGLWVEMTQTDTLDISWTRPESTLIRLCRGWNLIGYPVGLALPVPGALSSIDGKYDRVFGWDAMDVADPWAYYDVGVPNWANDLQMLEPGRGYWVHATQDANLIVTPPATPPEMDIPGCIASPEVRARVSERVPVVLKEGPVLRSVMVDYWPVNDLNAVQVLSTAVQAAGGSTVATLDTTALANGSYAIRVSGTDEDGERVACGTMVTVEGEYKPGRVRFTVTDLTVPVAGLPIQVGRTYDSLERHKSGDFGYGWSPAIGNPKLEADPDHNVTVTMPDGRRVTFYYSPQVIWGFGIPQYIAQPGVYGSLEAKACGLVVNSGGQWFCFPGNLYQQSVTGYVYTDPYGREFDMGLDGRLNAIKDLNGNTLTFGADGIRSSVGGLEVTFERDGEGRITTITDSMDNLYGYEYDAAGNLVRVNLPGVEEPVKYTYNADHHFLGVEDPRGFVAATATYYPDGRLQSDTDALGNTYWYEYDLDAHTTTVTNPDGGKITDMHDAHGNLLSHTDPLSRTTTYAYDGNHNMLSYTNGAGETAHFTYDSRGSVSSSTNPAGETVMMITYNEYGGPTSLTDALGNTHYITYDERYMPVSDSDSLGVVTTYTWDSHGSLLMRRQGGGSSSAARGGPGSTCRGMCKLTGDYRLDATEPLSRTMSYTYDEYGNRTSETDALGRTTRYAFDTLGRMVSVTDADGYTTQLEYDEMNNLITYTDPLSQEAHLEYDVAGNRTAVIDSLERQTTYEYDFLNHLVAVTYPDGTSTTFTYDFRDNLLTETDPTGRVTRYEYDLAGQLISVTSAYGTAQASTVRYTYDDAGRLISQTDGLGHSTTYAYDAAGQPSAVTDPLSNTQTYDYDAAGQLVATTGANGHTTRFAYDAYGRRTSTTYADGSAAHYAYNAFGDLIEEVAPCGVVTQYEYDAAGQSTQTIQAAGTPHASTVRYTYDNLGRLTSRADPLGNVTTYAYDAVGQLVSETDPLENATTYAYDEMGRRVSMEDARDNVTQYEYDARDRLVLTTYPDGTTQERTYDAAGRPVDTVDESENVTHREYDAAGRLSRTVRAYGTPDASTHQYHYDLTGRMVGATNPRGNRTRYVYDAAGRLEQVVDPLGYATTYAYDPVGQLLSTTDANGHQTQYDYDLLGRLVRTTYADGTTDLRGYDCGGRLVSATDQAGKVTAYDYDDAGRLVAVTDPLSHTIRYDLANNLLSITDANDHRTSFAYDVLGRRERKTWPDGSFETFGYDPVGNLLSHTLADGNSNTFTYDSRDRLARADYFDVQVFEYTYTPTGRRETVTDGRGITGYAYDDLERLVQITQPDGRQMGYGYDAAGNRLSITTPAGTTSYGYDELDRLTSVIDSQGGETTFAYDPVGLPTQKNLPNGISVDYGYDELNRLTSVVQHDDTHVLASYEYTLGPASNRLSVTDENGSSIHWTYDDAYRLIGETFRDPNGTLLSRASYTYDPVGNRLGETVNGVTTDYTYNELDQLVSRGSTQYAYDGRGNLIRVTTGGDVTQYTWDAAGRLTGVTMPGGPDVTYTYDADGRRVRQTVGAQVTNYLWDEASVYGDVVLETSGSGAILASYVLAETELVLQRRGDITSYYLHDAQGSVRALADAGGEITDRYTYAAFGELLEREGTTDNPYLYTGQQLALSGVEGSDELAELYNLRARYYNPSVGRFLSRDPFEGTMAGIRELNRYVYAANDPINLVDPTGQQSLVAAVLIRTAKGVITGAVAGFCAGLASSGFFLVLVSLSMCPGQRTLFGQTIEPGGELAFVAEGAIRGMIAGAVAGGLIGLASGLAQAFLTALAGPALGPAAGLGVNVGVAAYGVWGIGKTALQLLANKELCQLAAMVVGIAVGVGVGYGVGKWLNKVLPEPWPKPGKPGSCPGGDCDGDDVSSGGPGRDQEILDGLPPRPGNKGPTTGTLVVDGRQSPQMSSGWDGPAEQIPRGTPGFDIVTRTHVEGHAAAQMRLDGVESAELFINNVEGPCSSCDKLLPTMLPSGAELRVVWPGGEQTYVGLP
jgi:RHS repeat-associated protein